jgi:hypothetical protein
MVTKNVGALAIFMPIALQLARRSGTPPSALLMPMAFASLIGGIVTLVGTSPNVIVSKVRADLTGHPFGMFDYAPVGLCVAAAGFAFLCLGWRLLPRRDGGTRSLDAAFTLERYTTEARLPRRPLGRRRHHRHGRSRGRRRDPHCDRPARAVPTVPGKRGLPPQSRGRSAPHR